jgi:hypothetical protein
VYNLRSSDTEDFNPDFELVPQIVETIGTGMAPEIEEDLEAFVALEARIEDLVLLRETIIEQCGMSQTFAMEAKRLLPEFDQGVPLGFYTSEPSATRFGVALEELSSGIWALIAAGIAACIAAIIKFFKWLGKGDEAKAEERTKNAVESLKEAMGILDQCDKLVAEGAKSVENKYLFLKDKPQKEHFSMDSLIKALFQDNPHDQRISAFLQSQDPFFHDLVNKGPYTKELGKLAGFFNNLQIILKQRVHLIEQVSNLDLSKEDVSNDIANIRMLDSLSEPTRVHYDGKEMTLAEVKDAIQAVTHEVHAKHPESNLSFDSLFSTMSQAMTSSDTVKALEEVVHFMPLLEKMKGELAGMEKTSGRYTTDGQKGKHSTLVGTGLRHAIFVLGGDLGNLSTLASEVMQYQHRMLYLSFHAAEFAEAVAMKLATEVRDQSGAELEVWRGIAKELQAKRKELQQLYRA